MPLVEIIISPRHTVLPVLLVLLYMGGCVLSCVNTGIFYQHNKAILPLSLVNSHLCFCIVGFVLFFCVSALFWLWSAKYSHTRSERTWRLFLGVWVVSLFKDLPLFVIESMTVASTGWWAVSLLQGVCYTIQTVFFVVSITVTAMSYSWYASGVLERIYGTILEVGPHGQKVVELPLSSVLLPAGDVRPPIMLQDSSMDYRAGYANSRRGNTTSLASAYRSGGLSSPQPKQLTAYEANYNTMNHVNPVWETVGVSGARLQSVDRSPYIPPSVI